MPLARRAWRISFFKEDQWPEAAPRPRALLDRADELIQRVNRALMERGSHRVVATMVIHANQRLGVSVRGDADARFQVRAHWALFAVPDLDQALLQAVLTGNFPPYMDQVFAELGPQLGPDHIYNENASGELTTDGEHFDLDEVLRSVTQFLPPTLSAEGVRITWGKRPSTPNKRTIRLGSMDVRRSLIRIHPVLDSPFAPRFVVEFVVWHELCHYVAPPQASEATSGDKKRKIHHPEFLALEERYPHHQEANRWIRKHIDALLQGELKNPLR